MNKDSILLALAIQTAKLAIDTHRQDIWQIALSLQLKAYGKKSSPCYWIHAFRKMKLSHY
ncbi:MAG: hypothetical protein ACL7BU_11995 [Candidatus Phlomobacter fragariae]